jgi:prepilin-type N-terminal cleavage/methylation domain-containing protein
MSTTAIPPSARERRQRGFSIAELMVVVGLITIASTIAFSTMMPYADQYRVKGASFAVAAELQRARMEAVRTRLCHFFDRTSQTQYRIVRDNAATPNCTLGADDTTVRTIDLSAQFPGVQMNQGSNDIDPFGGPVSGPSPTSMRFEPRGLVTTVGGSSVFLKSSSYGPWAVTVTAAGAVRTWRKDGTTWK